MGNPDSAGRWTECNMEITNLQLRCRLYISHDSTEVWCVRRFLKWAICDEKLQTKAGIYTKKHLLIITKKQMHVYVCNLSKWIQTFAYFFIFYTCLEKIIFFQIREASSEILLKLSFSRIRLLNDNFVILKMSLQCRVWSTLQQRFLHHVDLMLVYAETHTWLRTSFSFAHTTIFTHAHKVMAAWQSITAVVTRYICVSGGHDVMVSKRPLKQNDLLSAVYADHIWEMCAIAKHVRLAFGSQCSFCAYEQFVCVCFLFNDNIQRSNRARQLHCILTAYIRDF